MTILKKVLIAAGGTGGHIFPALVVAKQLAHSGIHIHWVGSSRDIEQRLIAPHYPLTCIKLESLRGRGWKSKLLLPWRLCRSVLSCCAVVIREKPDVVLTMGSFVSAPVGLAAWLLRRPLVVHEQNSIAGLTNQWLSTLSKKTLEAFPGSFKNVKKADPILVGNPVRSHFFQLLDPEIRLRNRTGPLKIFVFGGSQGAQSINQVVAKWLEQYAQSDQVQVKHQCGKAALLELQERYDRLEVEVDVAEFIDDMAAAYEWADLVVSRSGALSVAEIAAVGVASILVPFPYAVDDHQRYNAAFLSDSGAAIVVDEKQFTPQWLANKVNDFLVNREALITMAVKAKGSSKEHATEQVIAALADVALVRKKPC